VIGTQRLPEKFSRNDMYLLISEYLSQHGRGE
jgi:hypothetical protein